MALLKFCLWKKDFTDRKPWDGHMVVFAGGQDSRQYCHCVWHAFHHTQQAAQTPSSRLYISATFPYQAQLFQQQKQAWHGARMPCITACRRERHLACIHNRLSSLSPFLSIPSSFPAAGRALFAHDLCAHTYHRLPTPAFSGTGTMPSAYTAPFLLISQSSLPVCAAST